VHSDGLESRHFQPQRRADTRAVLGGAACRLYELFIQLDGIREPAEVVRRSAKHNVHFLAMDQWPSDRYMPNQG
jgi:hypothetical protein